MTYTEADMRRPIPARYNLKPGHKEQGQWSWNDLRLWSKIKIIDNQRCYQWLGSMTPGGAVFGAYKNGRSQMTQARRLIWMSVNQQPVDDISINMRCNNPSCCNPSHFIIEKNKRRQQ